MLVSERDEERVFTVLGPTCAPRRDFVLDGGVQLGLSGDAEDAVLHFGLTHDFGG